MLGENIDRHQDIRDGKRDGESDRCPIPTEVHAGNYHHESHDQDLGVPYDPNGPFYYHKTLIGERRLYSSHFNISNIFAVMGIAPSNLIFLMVAPLSLRLGMPWIF